MLDITSYGSFMGSHINVRQQPLFHFLPSCANTTSMHQCPHAYFFLMMKCLSRTIYFCSGCKCGLSNVPPQKKYQDNCTFQMVTRFPKCLISRFQRPCQDKWKFRWLHLLWLFSTVGFKAASCYCFDLNLNAWKLLPSQSWSANKILKLGISMHRILPLI